MGKPDFKREIELNGTVKNASNLLDGENNSTLGLKRTQPSYHDKSAIERHSVYEVNSIQLTISLSRCHKTASVTQQELRTLNVYETCLT